MNNDSLTYDSMNAIALTIYTYAYFSTKTSVKQLYCSSDHWSVSSMNNYDDVAALHFDSDLIFQGSLFILKRLVLRICLRFALASFVGGCSFASGRAGPGLGGSSFTEILGRLISVTTRSHFNFKLA